MNQNDYIALLDSMYLGFFDRENIRNLPDEWICDEMLLALEEFDPNIYDKELDDTVSFGVYDGNLEELREKVGKVVQNWTQSYNGTYRAYCGYVKGRVVSFCLIEDKGVHNINGKTLKIGGPGCVGTLPEYRNRGIGLTMIRNVTQILKEEGFDYSYIHFTGVADWYAKLGYKSTVRWNKNGILQEITI